MNFRTILEVTDSGIGLRRWIDCGGIPTPERGMMKKPSLNRRLNYRPACCGVN